MEGRKYKGTWGGYRPGAGRPRKEGSGDKTTLSARVKKSTLAKIQEARRNGAQIGALIDQLVENYISIENYTKPE